MAAAGLLEHLAKACPTFFVICSSAIGNGKESVRNFCHLFILEFYFKEVPESLLRDFNGIDKDTIRARLEKIVCNGQDEICNALAELAGALLHQDTWTRPGGGSGTTGALQDRNVFEKAGVNMSGVYGAMPAEAYRAATGGNINRFSSMKVGTHERKHKVASYTTLLVNTR